MKRYFVSYFYIGGGKIGVGSINITCSDGFYSIGDINDTVEVIKPHCKKSLGIDDDTVINIVILNWRKYDFSLSLWIKDIFNKIRGRK